ncbi:MAG: hypothetical protein R6T92_00585, partial [Desulfosalsimonadaceae bacterium]
MGIFVESIQESKNCARLDLELFSKPSDHDFYEVIKISKMKLNLIQITLQNKQSKQKQKIRTQNTMQACSAKLARLRLMSDSGGGYLVPNQAPNKETGAQATNTKNADKVVGSVSCTA